MKRALIVAITLSVLIGMFCPIIQVAGEESSTKYATGLILDRDGSSRSDIEMEQSPFRVPSNFDFPSKVDWSTSPAFPPIVNQGQLGSCTTFATTYYQFTYMVNSRLGRSVSSVEDAYSPKWVYNSLNEGNMLNGTSFVDCYEFLYTHGALKWSDFPYAGDKGSESNYTEWPGAALRPQMREALNVRLFRTVKDRPYSTITISSNGTPITSNVDSNLDNIKYWLSRKNVLTIGISWDGSEKNFGGNIDFRNAKGSNERVICRVASTPGGGHALAVVGYDDDIWVDLNQNGKCEAGEKGAFKVANSWGDQWENNGYIWVLYDALNKVSSVSGWETGLPAGREGAFSQGSDDNIFYMIQIEKKDVMLVAESRFYVPDQATVGSNCRVRCARLSNGQSLWKFFDSNAYVPKVDQTYYSIIDYDTLCSPISSYLTGYNWAIAVPFDRRSGKLTDNLGNTVKVMTYNTSNQAYRTSLSLTIGDVDYDGVLTEKDVDLIMEYAAEIISFSNLQCYLGDYNQDGITDSGDVVALSRAIS